MKILLSILVAALGAVILSLAFGEPEGPGWLHLVGLGERGVLLVIWLSPGIDQPRQPPP